MPHPSGARSQHRGRHHAETRLRGDTGTNEIFEDERTRGVDCPASKGPGGLEMFARSPRPKAPGVRSRGREFKNLGEIIKNAKEMSRSASLMLGAINFAEIRCPCGVLLAQKKSGRPRATCSDACRRRLDALRRRVRTKQKWILGWHQLGQSGQASPAEVRRAVRLLEQDIRELCRAAPPADTPRGREGVPGGPKRKSVSTQSSPQD